MTNKTLDILFTGRVIDFRMAKGQQKQFIEKYKGKVLRGLVVKKNNIHATTEQPFISVTIKTVVDDKIEEMGFNKINMNTMELVNDANSMLFKLEYEGRM